MSSIGESIALAAPSLTGQLLRPTDHGYDDVRRVHNGLIDKHPAIVARCHGVADVVDAVQLARTLGLEVSVRGGGHNVAGRATIDQGLMIDLSPMKGVHVDPRTRTCALKVVFSGESSIARHSCMDSRQPAASSGAQGSPA